MTLRQGVPQKKYKQRRKKLGEQPIHVGDTLPLLTDGTGRTAEDLFPDWKKTGATIKEAAFAAEYLITKFNARQAMKNIDPALTESSATSLGSTLLRSPVVQQLLYEYTSTWLRGKAFELEHNLIETLQALAFYDVSSFINPDGTPRFSKWEEIPVPLRRCIEGIEVRFFGAQANRQTVNFTFAKRNDALKTIASYVAIMRNGPLASSGAPSGAVSPEAELVLSAVLNSGRKVDRRSPAQLRADKAKQEEEQFATEEKQSLNEVVFSGLG